MSVVSVFHSGKYASPIIIIGVLYCLESGHHSALLWTDESGWSSWPSL